MTRLRKWLRLQRSERLLLLEAGALLVVAGLAIACVPFRHLAPWLRAPIREGSASGACDDAGITGTVSWAVQLAARALPWKVTCFAQAITAKVMLRRRSVPSTLYLGVAHDGPVIHAHAWLRSGATVVTGANASDRFVAVCSFT